MRSDNGLMARLLDAVWDSWRRGFSWRGRSTRTQLFVFHLTTAGISYGVLDLEGAQTLLEMGDFAQHLPAELVPEWNWRTVGALVFNLVAFIPNWMLGVRRLHDSNKSGMWLLIAMIPIIGLIVILIMMLLPGSDTENTYGPNPRLVEGSVPEAF